MAEKVSASTLRRKKEKWQKILGLDDWKIKIKYPSGNDLEKKNILEDDLACMLDCDNNNLTATIIISHNYHLYLNKRRPDNIDTIIIHELIHILINEQFEELAHHIKENAKIKALEEYICDTMSEIIFSLEKN